MAASERLPGLIFVLIGPGGAGKNAIMKAVIARSRRIQQLATATTRPMRGDERQGREHLFVSLGEFQRMKRAGELLECQEVTPGKFYGIPRRTVLDALRRGCVRIADIEVLGAKILASAFPANVTQIFVTVPGATMDAQLQVLRQRMTERADLATDIDERLRRAKALELPYQAACDYTVFNQDLERAIEATMAIIDGELAARQIKAESR